MNRKQRSAVLKPFTLEPIDGGTVSIPHTTQLTHLQFRRFAGCPMCNLHIQSFINRHNELLAHNLQLVAVFHSTRNAMLEYHARAPFPLIADPTKSLYKAFGVESSIRSVLNPTAWLPASKDCFATAPAFLRGENPPWDCLRNFSSTMTAGFWRQNMATTLTINGVWRNYWN